MGSIVSGIGNLIGSQKAASASTNAGRTVLGSGTAGIGYEQAGLSGALGYENQGLAQAMGEEQAALTGAGNIESPYIQAGTSMLPGATDTGNLTYGSIGKALTGAQTAYNGGRPDLSPTTLYELNQMTPMFNQQMAQRGLYNSGAAVAGLSNMYANLGAQNYQQAFTNLNAANQTGLSATNPLLAASTGTAQALSGQSVATGATEGNQAVNVGLNKGNQSVMTGANQANTAVGTAANAAGYAAQAGAQAGQGYVAAGNSAAGGLAGYGQNMGFSQGMGSGAGLQNFANEFAGDIMGFAEGGRPPVGQPARVGEKGPEVFVPDQPGTIVPNQQTGLSRPPGSALSPVNHSSTSDAEMKARAEKAIHDEVIKQHKSAGMFSPHSDDIAYHMSRSAGLAGEVEYHKAKREAQKGLSTGGQ